MDKLMIWQDVFCSCITPVDTLESFKGVEISVKRDDQNHPRIQGNKLRKLKYNVKHSIKKEKSALVTFGGAWSNHISAVAHAASQFGMKSIGFIRGDELKNSREMWNKTLRQAEKDGMVFNFLSRKEYRLKSESTNVKHILEGFDNDFFLVPEGGSNSFAIKGVEEVIYELKHQVSEPSHIITACGTGGTMAGLVKGVWKSNWHTKVIGIPVLKNGMFLKKDIDRMVGKKLNNWQLFDTYHFGGYGKITTTLINFGKNFVNRTGIDLDRVYTSKVFYATYDLIDKGIIPPKSRVLVLHTGGLQGGSIINAMN